MQIIKILTTLVVLSLMCTTILGSVFKFNITFASSTENDNQTDSLSGIGTLLATAFGIGGLFWGIYTYRGSQTLKRQQILFPLIKEFDKSNEMSIAKALLDNYYVTPRKGWKLERYYYHRKHLDDILSMHAVDDPGEAAIRKSFDTLLDFFCKLEYLLDINLITPKEIDYFSYYIDQAADEPSVIKYIIDYKFPLRGKLNYNLFKPY